MRLVTVDNAQHPLVLMAGQIKHLDELHADIPDPIHLDDPKWFRQAACRGMDPDLWHPRRGEDSRNAKRICQNCPVRVECLAHAVYSFEDVGVWGGRSERERRAIRREMHRRGLLSIVYVDRRRSDSIVL